jgi:putative flippase GtrA
MIIKKFVLFCFIGAGAFIIDWGLFNLFYFLGLEFTLSLAFSWMISMIFNFLFNRNITFSARAFSLKSQIPKWLILHLIAFLIRMGIGRVIVYNFGESTFNANLAFGSGLLISIPLIFFGSLLWAFRKN